MQPHTCHLLKRVFTRDEYEFAANKVEALTSSEVYGEAMARFLEDFAAYVQATR